MESEAGNPQKGVSRVVQSVCGCGGLWTGSFCISKKLSSPQQAKAGRTEPYPVPEHLVSCIEGWLSMASGCQVWEEEPWLLGCSKLGAGLQEEPTGCPNRVFSSCQQENAPGNPLNGSISSTGSDHWGIGQLPIGAGSARHPEMVWVVQFFSL